MLELVKLGKERMTRGEFPVFTGGSSELLTMANEHLVHDKFPASIDSKPKIELLTPTVIKLDRDGRAVP